MSSDFVIKGIFVFKLKTENNCSFVRKKDKHTQNEVNQYPSFNSVHMENGIR